MGHSNCAARAFWSNDQGWPQLTKARADADEPIGAVLRVPAQGELRANFASDGSAAASAITARDREICRRLAPALRANGLWLVGIDFALARAGAGGRAAGGM